MIAADQAKTTSIRIGERFGELVIVRRVGSDRSLGTLWECACDCGRVALRRTQALTKTRRNGGSSACGECNREARRGHWVHVRERLREHFLELWEEHRTLYGAKALARIYQDIKAESDPRIHDEEPVAIPIEYEPPGEPATTAGYAMTLEEIGAHLELSKERIRQIERKALRKLARSAPMQELIDRVQGARFWNEGHDAALARAGIVSEKAKRLRSARTQAAGTGLTPMRHRLGVSDPIAQARLLSEIAELEEWLSRHGYPT